MLGFECYSDNVFVDMRRLVNFMVDAPGGNKFLLDMVVTAKSITIKFVCLFNSYTDPGLCPMREIVIRCQCHPKVSLLLFI